MKSFQPYNEYLTATRTASYGFIAALPLLIAYEVLILMVNSNQELIIRVGADIWLKQIFAVLGVKGQITIGAITIFIGVFIFFLERKKEINIRISYFPWIIIESLFYSVFLTILISYTVNYLFSINSDLEPSISILSSSFSENSMLLQIALSIGAGLYEELFFRVLLISLLFFIIKNLVFNKTYLSYILSASIAAIIFSAVHYIGTLGDEFTVQSFAFRFLFGLAFNFLYVIRGFGVVAWTHALYDILLTLGTGYE